ncbi:hypothetical protein HYDPIDRAFT_104948 [Hydnomerulius pinastri MD-312]|nr:hypothetical protein HYDPIDRAFT_104948 [Hydnomerulius pinastri MD-312]
MRLFPEPGPNLPQFSALLVHGPYHPSAPIHLCLSMAPGDKAMLLTPSRQLLSDCLRNYNDEWINSYSGTGAIANLSPGTSIFYPPTPRHLVALLSMLRTHNISTSAPVDPKATIDVTPTLLILHEPSTYFLPEAEDQPHTVSSYLLLITHALASVEFLASKDPNSPPISLVVFDSKLDQLKFPVLRAPPRSAFDEPEEPDEAPRPESVAFFTRKYFDMVGIFQSCP